MGMKRLRRFVPALAALALGVVLVACCSDPSAARAETTLPVHGQVTYIAAFDRFIATWPRPADFHSRYPDVKLVLPGEMATKELRLNHSRYFAVLGADGRMQGGDFK